MSKGVNNNRCPLSNESYKKINIGNWYNNQKIKINNKDCDIYIKLCINPIIKNNMDKYLSKYLDKI